MEWRKESTTADLTIITEDGPYTLPANVVTRDQFYHCIVYIQHCSDNDTTTV